MFKSKLKFFYSLIYCAMSCRCCASAENGRRFSSPHGPQHGDRSHTCTGKPHSHYQSNTALISIFIPQPWGGWAGGCVTMCEIRVVRWWDTRQRQEREREDIKWWDWFVDTEIVNLCETEKPDGWLARMRGMRRMKTVRYAVDTCVHTLQIKSEV